MRVVIAGGGTGGHLFPGIAIAEEFLRRDGKTEVIFIGTDRGIESRLLGKLGYDLEKIDIEGVKGRGIKALAKGFYRIPKSMWQSRQILNQFRPELVMGVGGYASGPAVLAAHFMGIPTAIAEQNATPGITNKILGKFVDKVFVTYVQTQECFSRQKVILSGNPVRLSVATKHAQKREKKEYWQVLVFGGSQGAEAINKCIVDMLPRLQEVKERVKILHQTGSKQLEDVSKAYKKTGVDAEVKDFIIDMAGAYADADLIICRAGATSLAEITAAGRAAVLIPFPFAANDHQLKNAQALATEGAAVVISERELSAEKLFDTVMNILKNEETLRRMEDNSLRMSKVDAARTIADHCLELIAHKKQMAN